MARIVLYHHVQGLTDGMQALADDLRTGGHSVETPDLFGGRTFETLQEGMAFARETGFGALAEQGLAAAGDAGVPTVYAGVSLGVMVAQQLAQTRADARGALLLCGCLPASEFGEWPAALPAQVHGKRGDEFFEEDLPAARELAEKGERVELFLYEGPEHLFVDSSLASYDREAAALVTRRALEFLEALDA